MIFRLLIIHNHDRVSSTTRVIHSATWEYFTSQAWLPDRFIRSPREVREAIMTDITDLVQMSWRTSSDGAFGASFFALFYLLKILQECFDILEKVCFDISIAVLGLPSTSLIKIYRS